MATATDELVLPFLASSVVVARNQLRDWLNALGQPLEVIEDSRLVVSELVGNAVRHAAPLEGGTLKVAWARDDDGLDIAVTDGGAVSIPRQVDPTDTGGRGLAIVDQLASRWWHDSDDAGTTVHARLNLDTLS